MASNTDYTKFKNAPLYAQNSGVVAQCNLSDWFWKGQVDDEPILPLTAGVAQSFALWRKPTSIGKVVQYATGKTFAAGTDYTITPTGICIPATSAIPSAPAGFLTTTDPTSPYLSQSLTKENGPLYLGNNYSLYQVAVTYQTALITPPEANPLPKLSQALSAKTPYAITFFGDSISAGNVTSSMLGLAPNAPDFADMLGAYLSTVAPGTIYWRNMSVSGMSSGGALAAASSVLDTASDMFVIGFGMNDASGSITKEAFKANISQLMYQIWQSNGAMEFVLLSGITSNPDWINTQPLFHGYRDVLHELAGYYQSIGVAVTVVDVTAVWEDMLRNKSYYDVTANGVNHPGDFGHKLYAQTIIQALCGTEPT